MAQLQGLNTSKRKKSSSPSRQKNSSPDASKPLGSSGNTNVNEMSSIYERIANLRSNLNNNFMAPPAGTNAAMPPGIHGGTSLGLMSSNNFKYSLSNIGSQGLEGSQSLKKSRQSPVRSNFHDQNQKMLIQELNYNT